MKDPLLYKILRPPVVWWFKATYKPIIINKEVIPKKSRAVLAGTHVSKEDVFLVLASTKRCIRGVAKNELFKGPGKFFFRRLGAIPVDRNNKDYSVIPACVNVLNQDAVVGIMPEGTINRTNDIIMPFKTGAVRMAIESNSPIIPFAIIGEVINDYRTFKKGIKIVFGNPYHPETTDVKKETNVLENKVIELINEYKKD